MKTEETECSKTSAYKIQAPGNYPEESIQQNFTYICHCVSLVSNGNKRHTPLLSGLIMFLAAECDQDREQSGGGSMLLGTMSETGYACTQLGVRI
jgi:hypothetical protein